MGCPVGAQLQVANATPAVALSNICIRVEIIRLGEKPDRVFAVQSQDLEETSRKEAGFVTNRNRQGF